MREKEWICLPLHAAPAAAAVALELISHHQTFSFKVTPRGLAFGVTHTGVNYVYQVLEAHCVDYLASDLVLVGD